MAADLILHHYDFSSQQEIDIESVKNRMSPAEIMTREDHQRTYGDLCRGEVSRS